MNTPTHLLIAAAVLTRKGDGVRDTNRRNWAVIAGALIPDAAIYILFVWARLIKGVSERELWTNLYWSEPWQSLVAIFNSIPLFGFALLVGLVTRNGVVIVFALAALLHLAFDLPFHHHDAHPHFWPFTDWRFRSPLSYWDSRFHGDVVSMAEMALAIILIVVLWRRFDGRAIRVVLGLALATYVAVPLYFNMMLG